MNIPTLSVKVGGMNRLRVVKELDFEVDDILL